LEFSGDSIDRQQRLDRYLLEAFLEHIPDNVFFKDLDSRFVRVSSAMAKYCGLKESAQAIRKTDADIFTGEHAEQALADEREVIRTGRPIHRQRRKRDLAGRPGDVGVDNKGTAQGRDRPNHRDDGNYSRCYGPQAGGAANPARGTPRLADGTAEPDCFWKTA
jgi:PAS domain S-box-containing protein